MISIAIDGPAGSGKSSIAKIIAKRLNFKHIETGSMYRSLAFILKKHKIDDTENELKNYLKTCKFLVEFDNAGNQIIFINDKLITADINTIEISKFASTVSASPIVREFLLKPQRELAEKYNVIMDGRDIGTVVLPKATIKIFLTASVESRAKRRYLQLNKANTSICSLEEILEIIKNRDYADSNRDISPLKMAEDAILFDNSDVNFKDSVNQILEIINNKLKTKISK